MPEIDQNKEKTVWIAVLHYQGIENTRACLSSIRKLNYPSAEILIADNCSPDRSGELLKLEFPDCHHLQLNENRGFAGGSNAAVNYCIERGATFVWLLNNDTEHEADALSLLIDAAEKNPMAGILGATVYTPEKGGFHRSGSGEIDFFKGKTYERGLIDENSTTIETQWLSGCNMLFRAEAFQKLNGFDESFFLYFEDTDLCFRMRQAGWSCLLVPPAKIRHAGSASTQGKLAVWRAYYHTRNRLVFFLRNRQGLASIPILLDIAFHLLRHCLVLPFRGENGRRQLKAELLGLSDFLQGKLGKADCLDF